MSISKLATDCLRAAKDNREEAVTDLWRFWRGQTGEQV